MTMSGETQRHARGRVLPWAAPVNLRNLVQLEIFIGIIRAITLLSALALPWSTPDCAVWGWSALSIGTGASQS